MDEGGSICTNLPVDARSCTWSDPDPATNNADVVVYAMNGTQIVATGTSGAFSIVQSGTGLPGGWHDADVGRVGAAGSAAYGGLQYDGNVFTVSGSRDWWSR